jgi:glycosyltransferase involved in cell wall biosynthesis
MKVLYFHQHFSTPRGAAGIRSYEMARALLSAGHTVTMVCGSYAGGNTGLTQPYEKGVRHGTVDGIEVIEFDLAYANSDSLLKRSGIFAKFALRSVGVALTERYDVLFATSTPLTAAIPGIVARWLRGARFVFEVRDLWPELPHAMGVISNPVVLGGMAVLEWLGYKSAHRLIGLSPGIVAGIARHNVDTKKIAMVPNGCDLDIFDGTAVAWRPGGVAPDDIMAVFAGTHGPANGLDAVLNAASELKRRGREDVKLVLIGQGKLKSSLQERAVRENLDNVIFCPPVPKARLAGLIAATDIGLQILTNVPAFYFGTSPNKFFDYIAAGRPVLINYPGWLAEKVTQNRCGYAVAADCPTAFADALVHAADHRDLLPEMGRSAHELAVAEFDRAKLAKQFVTILEQAASC